MKVIFLDVDGVQNFACTEARAPSGCVGVASQPLKVLSKIVKATGARIVQSSTWRREWEFEEESCGKDGLYLVGRLKRYGLHILDKTEHPTPNENRGQEIKNWLDRHPHVDKWIVLDDDIFYDFQENNIMPHLVQTNFYSGGLMENHIRECIEKLGGSEDAV